MFHGSCRRVNKSRRASMSLIMIEVSPKDDEDLSDSAISGSGVAAFKPSIRG
jgi:hypothetical protein